MKHGAVTGIVEFTGAEHLDHIGLEIDLYDIAAEKAIADDAIHFFAIHAAQYIVIIHMKIEVMHRKSEQVQGLVEGERYFMNTPDAGDGGIGCP